MYNLDDLCPRHRLEVLKYHNSIHPCRQVEEMEADSSLCFQGIPTCELAEENSISGSNLCERHRLELEQKNQKCNKCKEIVLEKEKEEEKEHTFNQPEVHTLEERCGVCTKQASKVEDNSNNCDFANICGCNDTEDAKLELDVKEEVCKNLENRQKQVRSQAFKKSEIKDSKLQTLKMFQPSKEDANNCCINIVRKEGSSKYPYQLKLLPLCSNVIGRNLYFKHHENDMKKNEESLQENKVGYCSCEDTSLESSTSKLEKRFPVNSNTHADVKVINNNAANNSEYKYIENATKIVNDDNTYDNGIKHDNNNTNTEHSVHILLIRSCEWENKKDLESAKTLKNDKEWCAEMEKCNRLTHCNKEKPSTMCAKEIESTANENKDSVFCSTPSPYSSLSRFLLTPTTVSEQHAAVTEHHVSNHKSYLHYKPSVSPLLPWELPSRTSSAPIHPYDLPSQQMLPPLCLSRSHDNFCNYSSINSKDSKILHRFACPSHKYDVKKRKENNNFDFNEKNTRIMKSSTEEMSQETLIVDSTSSSSSLLSCTRLPLAPIKESETLASSRETKKHESSESKKLNKFAIKKLPLQSEEGIYLEFYERQGKVHCTEFNTNEKERGENSELHLKEPRQGASEIYESSKRKRKKGIINKNIKCDCAKNETGKQNAQTDAQFAKKGKNSINAGKTVLTSTLDTPNNSKPNNCTTKTTPRTKIKRNNKNVNIVGRENDDVDDDDDSTNIIGNDKSKLNRKNKSDEEKNEEVWHNKNNVSACSKEHLEIRANGVKENILESEHVSHINISEERNFVVSSSRRDAAKFNTEASGSNILELNFEEPLVKEQDKFDVESPNNVHLCAFLNHSNNEEREEEQQQEQEQQQQKKREQQEEELESERQEFHKDTNCIVDNAQSKSYISDMHLRNGNNLTNEVSAELVDESNAHTPRSQIYDISSETHNSVLSTPSHSLSYCTPTSRTHFASLIKFASEEKAKMTDSIEHGTDDSIKFIFKAWSPLMDLSDNDISANLNNKIDSSNGTSTSKAVEKEEKDEHNSAPRLSCNDDKYSKSIHVSKETHLNNITVVTNDDFNKCPITHLSSSESESFASPSFQANQSCKWEILANELDAKMSHSRRLSTPCRREKTGMFQPKFTEFITRHICICVEPYSNIHMLIFFGKHWTNVLEQSKANNISVLKAFKNDIYDIMQKSFTQEHIHIHINYITAESTSLIVKFTASCDDAEEDQINHIACLGSNFGQCSTEMSSLVTRINNCINSSTMKEVWSMYEMYAKEGETAWEDTSITKEDTAKRLTTTELNIPSKSTLVSGEEIRRLTEPETQLKFTSHDLLPRLPVTRVCVEPSIEFAKHMTLQRSFTSSIWEPLFSLVVIDEATAKECFAAETKYMLRAKECVVQSLQFTMCENASLSAQTTGEAMSLTFLCLVEYDEIKCTREEQEKVNSYNYATLNKVVSEFYTLLCANIHSHSDHRIDSAENRSFLRNCVGRLRHRKRGISESLSSHPLSVVEPILSSSESEPASTEEEDNDTQDEVKNRDLRLRYMNNESNKQAESDRVQDDIEENRYNNKDKNAQHVCSSHSSSTHKLGSHINSAERFPSPASKPSQEPCANTSCNMMQLLNEEREELLENHEKESKEQSEQYYHSKVNEKDVEFSGCRSNLQISVKNSIISARDEKKIPHVDDLRRFLDSESESELYSINESKYIREFSKCEKESNEEEELISRTDNISKSCHEFGGVQATPERTEMMNNLSNSKKIDEVEEGKQHRYASISSVFSENKESDSSLKSNASLPVVYFCAKKEPSPISRSNYVWDDELHEVSDVEKEMQESKESIRTLLSSSTTSESMLLSSSPSELMTSLLLKEMEKKTKRALPECECESADEFLEELLSEELEHNELMQASTRPTTCTSNSSNSNNDKLHSQKEVAQEKKENQNDIRRKNEKKMMKKKKKKSRDNGKEQHLTVDKRGNKKTEKAITLPDNMQDIRSVKWLRCVLRGSHWPAIEDLAEEELSSALCEDFINATECLPYTFVEGWGTAHSDGLYIRYALWKNECHLANVTVKSEQRTKVKRLERWSQESKYKVLHDRDTRQEQKTHKYVENNEDERKAHDCDWSDEEVVSVTNYINAYRFPCVWEVYHKFNVSRDERFSPTMSWNLTNRLKPTQGSLSYGATLVAMKDDNIKEDFVNNELTVHLENLQEMKTTELLESSTNNCSSEYKQEHEKYLQETCTRQRGMEHTEEALEETHASNKKSSAKQLFSQEMELIRSNSPSYSAKESIEVSGQSYEPDKQPSMLSTELHKIVFGQAFTGERWSSVVENDKDYLRACFIKDAANALHACTHVPDALFANGNRPTYTIHITALAVKENKLNVYYTVMIPNDVQAEKEIAKSKHVFKEFVCGTMQSYNFPLTWALHDLHFAEQVHSPILSQLSSPVSESNKAADTLTTELREKKASSKKKENMNSTCSHKVNSYVVEPEASHTIAAPSSSEPCEETIVKSELINNNNKEINLNTRKQISSTVLRNNKRHKLKSKTTVSDKVIQHRSKQLAYHQESIEECVPVIETQFTNNDENEVRRLSQQQSLTHNCELLHASEHATRWTEVLSSEQITETEVMCRLHARAHHEKAITHTIWIVHEHYSSTNCDNKNVLLKKASSARRKLQNALSHSIDQASCVKPITANITNSPEYSSFVTSAAVKENDEINDNICQKVAEIQIVKEMPLSEITTVDQTSHVELQKSTNKKERKRHTKKHTLRLAHVSKLLEQLDEVQKMAESFPSELNKAIKTLPDILQAKRSHDSQMNDNERNQMEAVYMKSIKKEKNKTCSHAFIEGFTDVF